MGVWTSRLLILATLALSCCGGEGDRSPDDTLDASPSSNASDITQNQEDTANPARRADAEEKDTSQAQDSLSPRDDSSTPEEPAEEDSSEARQPPDAGAEDTQAPEDECILNADCEVLSEGMPCHISVCEFGTCLTVQKSDNSLCDDGNPCTADDFCTSGNCSGNEDLEAEGCANVLACDLATTISALPFSESATTIGESALYDTTECQGEAGEKGSASSEALYRFVPEESGRFVFSLSELDADPEALDALLYIVEGCPALGTSTCLAAQDIASKEGGERITLDLEAQSELFVVVDGVSNTDNVEGNFELEVIQKESPESDCSDGVDNEGDGLADCEDPGCVSAENCLEDQPGALCSQAIVIESLPFMFAGTTMDMGNESAIEALSCPTSQGGETLIAPLGAGSSEVFFSFTPAESGAFLVSLDQESSDLDYADLVLSVYEGACPTGSLDDLCVAAVDSPSEGGELLALELNAATPYIIVVDGPSMEFDVGGHYTLRLDALGGVPSGALSISEVMGNPEGSISDGNAEWIEVRNTTDSALSLKDVWLTYRTWNKGNEMPEAPSATYQITQEASLDALTIGVLAKSAEGNLNGNLSVLATYGNIAITNNGAKSIALELIKPGWNGNGQAPEALIIDSVVLPPGIFSGAGKSASFQLDEARASNPESAKMNDWAYRWCHTPAEDSNLYYETNHGSPGQANGYCEGADGPPPMTFEEDIKAILEVRCAGCHTGNGCSGGGCWDDYDDLMLDSYYCVGKTKGECTIVRIKDGSMPQASGCTGDPLLDADKEGCLSADEQQYIDWWVEGGMQP